MLDGRLKRYRDGEVSYVDNCDLDKMSLLEFDDIVKKVLMYSQGGRYYGKWEGNEDLLFMATYLLMMKFLNKAFVKVDGSRYRLSIQSVKLIRLTLYRIQLASKLTRKGLKKSMKRMAKEMKTTMKRMMREIKTAMKRMMREMKRAMNQMLRDMKSLIKRPMKSAMKQLTKGRS